MRTWPAYPLTDANVNGLLATAPLAGMVVFAAVRVNPGEAAATASTQHSAPQSNAHTIDRCEPGDCIEPTSRFPMYRLDPTRMHWRVIFTEDSLDAAGGQK